MKPHELLNACTHIIDTYDKKRTTVDAHADASPVLRKASEVEAKFIKQVFYGCIRYLKFLRIFVTGFLYKTVSAQRSDQTLYTVLAYLLIFRLRELGKAEFRNFIMCPIASPPAMLAFLKFASSEQDLNEWVKMEWCKLYDIEYIEKDIIGTIQELLPPDDDLINETSLKATGASIKEETGKLMESKRMHTVTEPFVLTVPKPRLVPLPEAIPRQIKAGGVNPAVYKNSLLKVEVKNDKRREKTVKETVHQYHPEQEFQLQTAERAADIDKLREAADANKFVECTFAPDLPNVRRAGDGPLYRPPKQYAEVQLNTGAILREDALLRKKEEQEYAILKNYEADLRDCSKFYEWQHEMKLKDQLEEQERVEQRKMEMKMARDDAMEVMEAMVRNKKIIASQQKEGTKTALDFVKLEKLEDEKEKKLLVAEVIMDRKLPGMAAEKIKDSKKLHAEELRKQKEVDFERKAKEYEYEMAKKKDLIRQIRAIERVSIVRPVPFDPSEPPRHGVLEEMSLAELHERLAMGRAKAERETEVKRLAIMEDKNNKAIGLLEKAENIRGIRTIAREESEKRREKLKQKKEEEEMGQQKVREACVLRAQEKIAAKKKERRATELKLKRELKEISTKRQFLQANAEMVEIKAYEEQQKGLEREAKTRQVSTILNEAREKEIYRAERKKRLANRQNEAEEHLEVQGAFDVHMELARIDDEIYTAEIRNANKNARKLQGTVEKRLKQSQIRDKPYAARMNESERAKVNFTIGSRIGQKGKPGVQGKITGKFDPIQGFPTDIDGGTWMKASDVMLLESPTNNSGRLPRTRTSGQDGLAATKVRMSSTIDPTRQVYDD